MRLRSDYRGRVGYVDVVMTVGTLVAFIAVAPWVYNIVGKIQGTADPLTGVLSSLLLPLLIIGLIISMGVSARSQ